MQILHLFCLKGIPNPPPKKKKHLDLLASGRNPTKKHPPLQKENSNKRKNTHPHTKKTHAHTQNKTTPKTPKTPETTFFLTGPSYDPTSARSDCGYRYASPLRCCLHPVRSEPVGPGSMGERKSRGKGEGGASLTSPKNDDLLSSICWVWPPSQDASDHCFFYYIFRLGNPEKNLYLPLLLGGGHTQSICV